MTHNQFAGRSLASNSRLPISPYTDRLRRRHALPPNATVIIQWNFFGNPGGFPTSQSGAWFTPPRTGSLTWFQTFVWTSGQPGLFLATWDPSIPSLVVNVQANNGSGFIFVDDSFPAFPPADIDYASGPLSWHNWSGTLHVFTQGHWAP